MTSGITHLMFFMKLYEGDFVHRDETKGNVRFYDEREWRFVPPIDDKHVYFLSKEQFADSDIREEHNNSLPNSASLKFTPDDIRYIIVESEDEIIGMVDDILSIKGDNYKYNQLKKLTTRIISAEQIREDF